MITESQEKRLSHHFRVSMLTQTQYNHFVLTWEGSRVPVGATLGTAPIRDLDFGGIVGPHDKHLGNYQRLQQSGGPSNRTQVVYIRTQESTFVPPPGGSVQRLAINAQNDIVLDPPLPAFAL